MNQFMVYQQKVEDANRYYLKELGIDTKNPSAVDVVKLNAFISCSGVTVEDKRLMKELIRMAMGDEPERRTGNVGLNILYGKDFGLDMRTVAPAEEAYADRAYTLMSPIKLIKTNNKMYLGLENIPITEVEILSAPTWYNERLPNGARKNSIFQDELRNLMGAIPTQEGSRQGCVYFSQGMPCAFCALQNKEKIMTPSDAATVVKDAYSEFPTQTTVTMTGGNTSTQGRGIEKYLSFVQKIREENSKVPIEIEVSPPSRSIEILRQLKDVGLTSYMSNLEVWSSSKRREICPEKSKIPLEDYMRAFAVAQLLGLPTYSVLIVGLETEKSTLEGVRYLGRKGVTTIPLPFKPLEKSIYQWEVPTDPSLFLRVSSRAIKIMRELGVNPMNRNVGGCSLCGGCSAEVNIDRNWSRIESELEIVGV